MAGSGRAAHPERSVGYREASLERSVRGGIRNQFKIKIPHHCEILYQRRGGRDSNPRSSYSPDNHLAGGPDRPLWHLPIIYLLRLPPHLLNCSGGGSGIRTHGGLPHTCFQDMRLRPLGHPSTRGTTPCATVF